MGLRRMVRTEPLELARERTGVLALKIRDRGGFGEG